jgi:hypothetical protein
MLEVTEDDDDQQIFTNEGLAKKHIREIRSHGFPTEVVLWIENEILNVKRRIHLYRQETLAAYVILAHQACGIPYNSDNIISVMKCLSKKKKVLDLITGISSKNSPVHDASISIPIIIKHANEFIEIVICNYFNTFYSSHRIDIGSICRDVLHFTNILYEADLRLSNFEPKSCACAFVYFYISTFCVSFERTCPVKKTDFKNMKFIIGTEQEGINPRNFDDCYDFIRKDYEHLCNSVNVEFIQKIICVN